MDLITRGILIILRKEYTNIKLDLVIAIQKIADLLGLYALKIFRVDMKHYVRSIKLKVGKEKERGLHLIHAASRCTQDERNKSHANDN